MAQSNVIFIHDIASFLLSKVQIIEFDFIHQS